MAATISSEMIGAPMYGQIRQSESSAPIAGSGCVVNTQSFEKRFCDA
jgi:hypothetical protein